MNYRFINYNGIDRKNSTLGYTMDNCVTCCGSCNIMKNKFTEEEFISKVISIYTNLNLINYVGPHISFFEFSPLAGKRKTDL